MAKPIPQKASNATDFPDTVSEFEDIVEKASKESFPASDPPAFNLGEKGKRHTQRDDSESWKSTRKG